MDPEIILWVAVRLGDAAKAPLALVKPAPLALSSPLVKGNSGPVGRGVPLRTQQQAFDQAQGGARSGARCRRGQAYHLTTEEVEASDEVVACKILVYSISVLSLFDSGASQCSISNRFVALHSIPVVNTESQ